MNKDAYTDGQKKRINIVNKLLENYKEFDVPTYIIKKINKLYPDTKKYDFIRTEQIEKGIMIRLVDLDFKKIYMPGIIVNIKETSSRKKGIVVLFNPKLGLYWSVNPDKYYIFRIYINYNKTSRDIRNTYNDLVMLTKK
jgi:hypothetical protein